MITRVSSVIRPKGSDLIYDHPYNARYGRLDAGVGRLPSSCRSPNSVRMLFGARAAPIAVCEYVKPDRIDAA
jgi:hypothetical protein